jgi:hypothetical protein
MSAPERTFSDADPLGEARAWLGEQLQDKGARCPCCTQMAKIYIRTIYAAQAAALITAYQAFGRAAGKWSELNLPGGDYAKLRFWDLIVDLREIRDDGGPAGWWQITELGEQWVRGIIRVPRRVRIYDNHNLGPDSKSDEMSIHEALGSLFNYEALMAAPGGGVS